MWHVRQVWASAILASALATVISAQAAAQPDPRGYAALYGNWELTWQRADRVRTGTASFTARGPGAITWANAPLDYFQSLRVEGAMIRGHSVDGRFELRLSAEGTAATGAWGGRPTEWRRIMETVERIEVVPGSAGTLDYARLRDVWRAARSNGNLPTITLRISGAGLPRHPSDAGMVAFDDPGFINPRLRRIPGSPGAQIEIDVALRDPRPGAQTVRINTRPFPFTLDLAGAPTVCTGIALAAVRPRVMFGEDAAIGWSFMPEGCTPPSPPAGQPAIVDFGASPTGIISYLVMPGMPRPWGPGGDQTVSRTPGQGEPVTFRAERPGSVEIRATFAGLAGATAIAVEDRPACTELQLGVSSERVAVGGQVELQAPPIDEYGVAHAYRGPGGSLAPPDCSVGRRVVPQIAVDRPDRARLIGERELHGLAPGAVTVGYRLGNVAATARIEVVPQPECDDIELAYGVAQIGVGEVVGPGYRRGGMRLAYARSDAPRGQEGLCVRPPGAPYFEAVNRAAHVDRASGEVTGLAVGTARIGVVHGTLIDIASLPVVADRAACTTLVLQYIGVLTPTGRGAIRADYQPAGCAPPAGHPAFSAIPPLVLITPQGAITATAPGTTRVTMRHGDLAASQEVVVGPVPPCTTMTAQFVPPEVMAAQAARLVRQYGPQPCAVPDDDPRYEPSALRQVTAGGELWVLRPTGYGPFEGRVAELQISHGPLGARVMLQVAAVPCTVRALRVVPDRIAYGDVAAVEIDADRPGCEPWIIPGVESDVLDVAQIGGRWLVRGAQGGVGRVYASTVAWGPRIGSNRVTVVAPPCTGLAVTYFPNPMPPGGRARAELEYDPPGCTRPDGYPRFTSDTPVEVQIADALPRADDRSWATGHGAAVARPGLSTGGRAAIITVRHGGLSASTRVTVHRE